MAGKLAGGRGLAQTPPQPTLARIPTQKPPPRKACFCGASGKQHRTATSTCRTSTPGLSAAGMCACTRARAPPGSPCRAPRERAPHSQAPGTVAESGRTQPTWNGIREGEGGSLSARVGDVLEGHASQGELCEPKPGCQKHPDTGVAQAQGMGRNHDALGGDGLDLVMKGLPCQAKEFRRLHFTDDAVLMGMLLE